MSIRPILASLCLTLLLAACGTLTPAPTPTPPATSTPAPTVTPTFDPAPLLQADPYPGTDLGLQPEAAYTLPDEVKAKLREMGAIPILANGRAGSVKDGLCQLPMPEQLVSGARVNAEAAGGGAAPFTLPDGQVDQLGIWQLPVEGDWQCVAFVAGLDNQLGLEPGTVRVLFFSGGGKGGVEILNLDNPLRVFVESPNRADVRLEDGRLVFKTLGPDNKVIEEQAVKFLTEEEIALRNMPDLVLNADRYDFESLPVVDWEDLANGRFWEKLMQMVEDGKVPIPPRRPLTPEEVAAYMEFSQEDPDGFCGVFWFNEDFYTKGNLDLRVIENRPSFAPAPYRTKIDDYWFQVEPIIWLNWDGSFGGYVGILRENFVRKNYKYSSFNIKDISQTNEEYFALPSTIGPSYPEECRRITTQTFCDLYYANRPRIKELLLEFKQTGIMPKELGRYPVMSGSDRLIYFVYGK